MTADAADTCRGTAHSIAYARAAATPTANATAPDNPAVWARIVVPRQSTTIESL